MTKIVKVEAKDQSFAYNVGRDIAQLESRAQALEETALGKALKVTIP